MRKYNNFSHYCQYKSNNSSVIITPSVFCHHQILKEQNLNAKHIVVLCHFLHLCWREQPRWLGEQLPTLDLMLSRPLIAKMVGLDYNSANKTLGLSKDQLKTVFIDLEQAKLLRRVLINNKWYVLLSDEAFKMYLNNNKNKKHRINKGNVISTSWLNTLKTANGQTDFTGALLLGEIIYFSRVFKRKKPINEYFEDEYHGSEHQDSEDQDSDHDHNISINQDDTVLLSKSRGLIAYFNHDHFKKKFPFLNSKIITRTLERLEKSNIIFVNHVRFMRGRKVIKRLYITLNYELIKKGVNSGIVDFIFKTDDYLNSKQLADFCQNTPPSLYYIYNNKTIIYPQAGFSNNFCSFSLLLGSSSITCIDQTQNFKQVSSQKWNQESSNRNSHIVSHATNYNDLNRDKQSQHEINPIEILRIKKRAFKVPRYLYDMHSSLKHLYRAYFACFDYPLSFCCSLLDSLAKKYSDVKFRGENQFISYFRKILAQEKRASWQVRNRKYFERALSLADLVYDKLPNLLKEKLNKLALQVGRKIEDLPALLSKLAIRNAKHVFSCVSSFLSYMKQVLSRLKSKEEIQEAYRALPRASIGEVSNYLSKVEGSYHRVGMQEHLRRKLASTLPMTVAYHLLHSCNFYSARIDDEKNFIIPSKNKNWAEMLRGGFKKIIKDQVMAVYGTIKAIKFVQTSSKENAQSGEKIEIKVRHNARYCNNRYAKVDHQYDTGKTQSFRDKTRYKTEPSSYHLFQQARLEEEQKAKKELAVKLSKEEQELKEQGINQVVYDKYKQTAEEVEVEKNRYIQQGGEKEKARELYKMLSFSDWLQLQELLEIA